jgi:hypothetical protein
MSFISKEEVKNIREKLKTEFPKFKFSVSGGNSHKLSVAIVSGPEDFAGLLDDRGCRDINHYHLHNYGNHETLFTKIINVMKSQNWFDDSDSMTDYFNVAYYFSLEIGRWDKPYTKIG